MNPIKSLSILVPCYNYSCKRLVETLAEQCKAIDGLLYEIVIVDDGSTDNETININQSLTTTGENILYRPCSKSKNRSAMRNRLADFAQHEWQLQINANVLITNENFIRNYLSATDGVQVVCGYSTAFLDKTNIRCKYEYYSHLHYNVDFHNKYPYSYFRNTNCLYHRDVFRKVKYDEDINGYGYEDTKFGQDLKANAIPIRYIDNPVVYDSTESNENYILHTEQALFNLYRLRMCLETSSPLLMEVKKLADFHILWIARLFHRLFGASVRRKLIGKSPSVRLFNIYKLGYYLVCASHTS